MSYDDDSGSDPFNLGKGQVTKETKMAVLVKFPDCERWIPKSVLHDDSEVFDGGENAQGTVVVKAWWAQR